MNTAITGALRLRFAHRLDLALMKGERIRYGLSHQYVDQVINEGRFDACRNAAEFQAKLLEAMIFLTSETGLHDVRTRSMPKERIHIQLAGTENQDLTQIPGTLRKIAALAIAENRAFLMRYTADRQIFCTGNSPEDDQVIYQALAENFGLTPIDTGSTTCYGLLVLPLVKASGIPVGVVVVEGPRGDFIRPHVDLAAIRRLGLHTAEGYRLS